MGREHVIQSWVKHDADDWRKIPAGLLDTTSGYSGEQVGNRQAVNNGNTHVRGIVPGFLPNGKADIDGAAEVADDSKGHILLTIDPAYKTLLEYPAKVAALDAALAAKQLPKSLYDQAMIILKAKHHKAQLKIDKLLNDAPTDEEEIETVQPVPPEYMIPSYTPTPEEEQEALKNYENSFI